MPADPAGQAQLAAAVAAASSPPLPSAAAMIPDWASAIASKTWVVSDNPLGLRTLALSFRANGLALVQFGFASGASGLYSIGLAGVPQLSWDPLSGHRVAMTGYWRPNAFDLDYNTIARIDEYRLHIMPAPNGLMIHLTERTGPVDVMLNAVPGTAAPFAVPPIRVICPGKPGGGPCDGSL